MHTKKTKGNSKIGLPFLLITSIVIILSITIIIKYFKYYPKEPIKNNSIPSILAQGIIYDIDLLNNSILINHNRIEGYKDSFDNMSSLFIYNVPPNNSNNNIGDSISFNIYNSSSAEIDEINNINYLGQTSMPIYDVTGVIHEIRSNENKLMINHQEIPGFMDKMTMLFNVHQSVKINNLEIGDSVNFKLFITPKNHFTISYEKVGFSKIEIKDQNPLLEEDNIYSEREIGEIIDNVTFLDLDGNKVNLDDINADIKVISLIFTRCPMPNMCPAIISTNQYLGSYFKNDNIKFIIISFDYLYDTPDTMKKKYEFIDNNYDNILFLSSYQHLNDLYQLSSQLNYEFWGVEENDYNSIGHMNRQVILNEDNEILKYYNGFEILPGDIKKDIEKYIK